MTGQKPSDRVPENRLPVGRPVVTLCGMTNSQVHQIVNALKALNVNLQKIAAALEKTNPPRR